MENGNKKKRQRVDLSRGVPILISLGDQSGRLENLLWRGRAGRDQVRTCASRHRVQFELPEHRGEARGRNVLG